MTNLHSVYEIGTPIYKYCSMSSFEQIIKNKVLWLTKAGHMKDKTEGKWLDQFLKKYPVSKERKKVLRKHKASANNTYLSCFSNSDAGDILEQWKEYADGGRGVCLGFKFNNHGFQRPRSIEDMTKWHKEELLLIPVIYDENTQKDIVVYIAPEHEYEDDKAGWIEKTKDGLIYRIFSLICKAPKYSKEYETRLIYAPSLGKAQGPLPLELEGPFTRPGLDRPSDYYKLPIDINGKYVELCSVMIGPKNEATKQHIGNLLDKAGFKNFKNIKTSSHK